MITVIFYQICYINIGGTNTQSSLNHHDYMNIYHHPTQLESNQYTTTKTSQWQKSSATTTATPIIHGHHHPLSTPTHKHNHQSPPLSTSPINPHAPTSYLPQQLSQNSDFECSPLFEWNTHTECNTHFDYNTQLECNSHFEWNTPHFEWNISHIEWNTTHSEWKTTQTEQNYMELIITWMVTSVNSLTQPTQLNPNHSTQSILPHPNRNRKKISTDTIQNSELGLICRNYWSLFSLILNMINYY